MANNFNYRYGDPEPVASKAVSSAVKIEIGDLVETDGSGNVTPASSHAWNTDLGTTQSEFHDQFLGVAQQASRVGDTDSISVDSAGVHEFDCAAATFELGDLVGPAKQSGNALENQKVVAVATADKAIGRVAKRYGSNTTKVLVRVESSRVSGGTQAIA